MVASLNPTVSVQHLLLSCSVAWGNPNSHGLIKLWQITALGYSIAAIAFWSLAQAAVNILMKVLVSGPAELSLAQLSTLILRYAGPTDCCCCCMC